MKYLVLAQHELELQCILLLVQRKKSQVNKRQRQSSRQPRGIVQCSQKDEVRGMRGLEARTVRWSSKKSGKNSLDSGYVGCWMVSYMVNSLLLLVLLVLLVQWGLAVS